MFIIKISQTFMYNSHHDEPSHGLWSLYACLQCSWRFRRLKVANMVKQGRVSKVSHLQPDEKLVHEKLVHVTLNENQQFQTKTEKSVNPNSLKCKSMEISSFYFHW